MFRGRYARKFNKLLSILFAIFIFNISIFTSFFRPLTIVKAEAFVPTLGASSSGATLDWFLTILATIGFSYTSNEAASFALTNFANTLDTLTYADLPDSQKKEIFDAYVKAHPNDNLPIYNAETAAQQMTWVEDYIVTWVKSGKAAADKKYNETTAVDFAIMKAYLQNWVDSNSYKNVKWTSGEALGYINGAKFLKGSVFDGQLNETTAGNIASHFGITANHYYYEKGHSNSYIYSKYNVIGEAYEFPFLRGSYGNYQVCCYDPAANYCYQTDRIRCYLVNTYTNATGFYTGLRQGADQYFTCDEVFSDLPVFQDSDAAISYFKKDINSIVKISTQELDDIDDVAVPLNPDDVIAATAAGVYDNDYSGILSGLRDVISKGNQQAHEDSTANLEKLGLISTLLSDFFDFFKEHTVSLMAVISAISTAISDFGTKILDAIKAIDLSLIVSAISAGVLSLIDAIQAIDLNTVIDAIQAIDLTVLGLINGNVLAILDAIPTDLPFDTIINSILSIPQELGIDLTNLGDVLVNVLEGIRTDLGTISNPIIDALNALGIGAIAATLTAILEHILSIDGAVTAEKVVEFQNPSGKDRSIFRLFYSLIHILILLLKIFLDCLIFITLIFHIPADAGFISNEYILQGLNFLKTTEITGFGISIYGFLTALVDIIIIFSVVGHLRRNVMRLKIK